MLQLLQRQRWDMLIKFRTTMRYVDDILSVDNDSFKQLLYNDNIIDGLKGIYPRYAVTLQLVDITTITWTLQSYAIKVIT